MPGHCRPAQPIQVECMSSLCSLALSEQEMHFCNFLPSSLEDLQGLLNQGFGVNPVDHLQKVFIMHPY